MRVIKSVLLNIGAEYDQAAGTPYSGARWNEWERTGAGFAAETPGARPAPAANPAGNSIYLSDKELLKMQSATDEGEVSE